MTDKPQRGVEAALAIVAAGETAFPAIAIAREVDLRVGRAADRLHQPGTAGQLAKRCRPVGRPAVLLDDRYEAVAPRKASRQAGKSFGPASAGQQARIEGLA